jgi:hypothetical protein
LDAPRGARPRWGRMAARQRCPGIRCARSKDGPQAGGMQHPATGSEPHSRGCSLPWAHPPKPLRRGARNDRAHQPMAALPQPGARQRIRARHQRVILHAPSWQGTSSPQSGLPDKLLTLQMQISVIMNVSVEFASPLHYYPTRIRRVTCWTGRNAGRRLLAHGS